MEVSHCQLPRQSIHWVPEAIFWFCRSNSCYAEKWCMMETFILTMYPRHHNWWMRSPWPSTAYSSIAFSSANPCLRLTPTTSQRIASKASGWNISRIFWRKVALLFVGWNIETQGKRLNKYCFMLKLRLDLAINYYGVPVTLPTQTYLLGEKTSQRCGGSQAGGGSGTNGKTRKHSYLRGPDDWWTLAPCQDEATSWNRLSSTWSSTEQRIRILSRASGGNISREIVCLEKICFNGNKDKRSWRSWCSSWQPLGTNERWVDGLDNMSELYS